MESMGFNGTLLAQLFNVIILLAIVGVFIYVLVAVLRTTPKMKREIESLNQRLREMEQILIKVERKIDKKNERV